MILNITSTFMTKINMNYILSGGDKKLILNFQKSTQWQLYLACSQLYLPHPCVENKGRVSEWDPPCRSWPGTSEGARDTHQPSGEKLSQARWSQAVSGQINRRVWVRWCVATTYCRSASTGHNGCWEGPSMHSLRTRESECAPPFRSWPITMVREPEPQISTTFYISIDSEFLAMESKGGLLILQEPSNYDKARYTMFKVWE